MPQPGAAPTEVVVDVAGRVRRPGIVRLPVGARVVDALEAAGGARPRVDLRSVNLARLLVDGEQVLVGVPPPAGVAASAAVPGAPDPAAGTTGGTAAPPPLVNINTADLALLDTLPGVGPVTAEAIIGWRTDNGGFTAVDDLLDVSGIGEATLAELAPLVTV
jgi:competence protein ComEA